MSLAQQIQKQIERFLVEQISLQDLRQWLAVPANVQAVAASQDPRAHELSDRVLILVSEMDYGHRTEQDIRRELKDALSPAVTLS